MTIPGGAQIEHAEGWSPDHLLLAALVRCSIDSFTYHARRAGPRRLGVGLGAREDHEARRRRALCVRDDRGCDRRAARASRRRHGRPDREGGARLLRRRVADDQAGVHVARVLTTVETARARFTALQQPLAFFDGPGGTQVPDSVIDAIATYLREANANVGGPFSTSQRVGRAASTHAHETAAEFLNATADEVAFGANMTTLNFALSRAASREWRAGDEIVCTRLDHDGNVAPWLEIAHDRDLTVRFADVDDECRLDLAQLASLLNERTRVVAFPWASNAVGTLTPVAEIVQLAHDAGALAWVDAVHYGPHGPIDVQAAGADVVLCSPYKFYGPHLGLAFGRRELLESWRPYKVRPAADQPVGAPLRDRDAGPRAARGIRRRGRLPRRDRLGLRARARACARRAVPRRATGCVDAARRPDDGRPRADLRDHARVRLAAGGSGASRRARLRCLARQLLRGRDHAAPRPGRRRGPRRHRPLQHRGRGAAPARRAGCASRRTDRPSRSPRRAASPASGGSGRDRRPAHRPLRASAGGSGRCPRPDAASGSVSRRPRAPRAR